MVRDDHGRDMLAPDLDEEIGVQSPNCLRWRLLPQLATRLVFPAPEGGYINLDNWRTREWNDALDAAGIARRGVRARRGAAR
jgi:hypothetical protein